MTRDQIPKVLGAFESAIAASFMFDDMNTALKIHRQTQAEVKRRFDICAKIFECCRGDLKWSLDRVIDHLPVYLRNELDGVSWEPSARKTWASNQEIKT
jgi:hypothetical protein